MAIAERLLTLFSLDEFVFIPAFHAPHKVRLQPTSAYDRYAMLCLSTAEDAQTRVSRIEIEAPDRPYSIETLTRLTVEDPNADIFFVMGADSWMDILTWREWENVLLLTNHIVVTRPSHRLSQDHVTQAVRDRIMDVRGSDDRVGASSSRHIYFTDAVSMDVSATGIRAAIRAGEPTWRTQVPAEVANYIEKYQIY